MRDRGKGECLEEREKRRKIKRNLEREIEGERHEEGRR